MSFVERGSSLGVASHGGKGIFLVLEAIYRSPSLKQIRGCTLSTDVLYREKVDSL